MIRSMKGQAQVLKAFYLLQRLVYACEGVLRVITTDLNFCLCYTDLHM